MNTLRCASRIGKLLICGDREKAPSPGVVVGNSNRRQQMNDAIEMSGRNDFILTNYLRPIRRSLTSFTSPVRRTIARAGSLLEEKEFAPKTLRSSSNLLAKYRVSSTIDLRTIGMKPLSSFDWFNRRRASSASLNYTSSSSKLPDSPEANTVMSNVLTVSRSVQCDKKSRRNALVPEN